MSSISKVLNQYCWVKSKILLSFEKQQLKILKETHSPKGEKKEQKKFHFYRSFESHILIFFVQFIFERIIK